MSVETWKEEFYPVDATDDEVQEGSIFILLDHSILKWTGALPENLKKHDVELWGVCMRGSGE